MYAVMFKNGSKKWPKAFILLRVKNSMCIENTYIFSNLIYLI